MSTISALMTAKEFRQLPDVERYELVRGVPIEMPRPNLAHGIVCGNLVFELSSWARSIDAGLVIPQDTGVVTERDPDSVRGPDCMFVRKDRVGEIASMDDWLQIAPDLAVEVSSPSNRWPDLLSKTVEYLAFGVKEVWVFNPRSKSVHVFRQDEEPAVLEAGDELATDVLAGFARPVAEFFRGL